MVVAKNDTSLHRVSGIGHSLTLFTCRRSSMVRFLRIGLMVSGSSPPSAKLSLRMRSRQLSVIPGVNHEVWSHREEGPGGYSISKKLLSVQISTFNIYVGSYKENGIHLCLQFQVSFLYLYS